jgi:hypothetical protein
MKFRDYRAEGANWLTVVEREFYPDYLKDARVLYGPALEKFKELADQAIDTATLFRSIANQPAELRGQLLRVFRKYASPDTPVEMLKRKRSLEGVIESFGSRFRSIQKIREMLHSRPDPDEAIMAVMHESRDRARPGYELTGAFFAWFKKRFGDQYLIRGPTGAGRDVMLNEVLPAYERKTPADFLISRLDGTPLIVGFARYDSDRGGSQEDDRTGGNRDKVMTIREYAGKRGVPLKVLFLNDGPGLLLGSMWNDYADLEDSGAGDVMVCTLRMLDERLTAKWLES